MIKEKESSRGRNGFTLVELLAVIVILAIILVIAVPKVMSIIEDAKKGTLESTAKMIASGAEKAKVQNTVLGKTEEITCDSVAKINKGDYANCSIEFDNNTAKVTIEGKGKFDGLYVCGGTKTEATASNESCTGNCLISDGDVCVTEETPASCFTYERQKEYKVDNAESCVSYIEEAVFDSTGFDIAYSLCHNGIYEEDHEGTYYIEDVFSDLISNDYFTEEELMANNVLKVEYSDGLTITGYDKTCGIDNVVVPNTINSIDVINVGEYAFYEESEVCNDECSTQCDNPEDPYDCYEECWDDCIIETSPLPIKRIRFRENITYIDAWALGVSSLKYVYVENQDAEIGNCAFGDINNLEKHNLPNTYQCSINDDSDEEEEDYCEECDGCCDDECPDGTQEVCEEVCDDETGECWDDCWDECI